MGKSFVPRQYGGGRDLRIMQLADLHLDAPFSGVPAPLSAKLRAEQRETLGDYLRYADMNGIPLVVIAGDLFDGSYVTRDCTEALTRMFSASHAHIVISPGNHDPLNESSPYAFVPFPPNVHVFDSPDVTCFTFADVTVYGYAFTEPHVTDSPLSGFCVHDRAKLNILAAHADLDAPLSPYAPVSSETLGRCGFDYAALGHIHKASGLRYAGNTPYAYSGCVMGRGFDETGRKGALICDISKEGVHAEPLYLTKRRYEMCRLNLTGAADEREVSARLSALTADFDVNTHLRLSLEGTVTAGTPDVGHITAMLPPLAFSEVTDNTLPIDLASLETDAGVKGIFYRKLKNELLSEDASRRSIARQALYYGLGVLDGREIGTKNNGV